MSENVIEASPADYKTGLFLVCKYVGLGQEKNGYVDIYLRAGDEKYAAERFSAKVGSDNHLYFTHLAVGTVTTVEVSTPRLATSKAGKNYLSWFILGVEG